MNLKHPHDLVILMRQETTVNYLKELEVRQLDVCRAADAAASQGLLVFRDQPERIIKPSSCDLQQ